MSQPVIKIVPLPDDRNFETNSSIISGLNQSGDYLPNGDYEITSSSSSNVKHEAYHAFNDNKKYWETNYKGNPSYSPLNSSYPEYIRNAFTGSYPSAYQGGGRKDNTFVTNVGLENNVNDVKGEWIQIKIPYQMYLKSYIIEVPESSQSNKFPKEFIVVGSNNGQDWEALHSQTMADNFKGTKNQFQLTYPKKFSHFRLIVTTLQGSLDRVQLSNWSLFGNSIIVSDEKDNMESFVSLNRCLDCRENDASNTNDYSPYHEGFDNYTYTSELRIKHKFPYHKTKKNNSRKRVNKQAEERRKNRYYKNYAKTIENQQINPLQRKAEHYEDDVDKITKNYTNISDTLNDITNDEQTGILDDLKKQPSYTNSERMHNVDSIEEARLKDIEHMINTNNEIYVLGGIAAATLVVFGGMLLME